MCTYVCTCASVRATVREYHTSAVYLCGPCTHLYICTGGILLFTVCGSLSAPAQLKHEVEWLRRYGKVDSESLSDHVISDCECDCVCIALICLFCVHAVWCVWCVMNRGGGGGRTVCVYIHMCVCVSLYAHAVRDDMCSCPGSGRTCMVSLLYSIMPPLVTTRSALALPLHKSYYIRA